MVLLNILIRIPSVPHESGSPDEFIIHVLANSVSTYGYAKWWIHPLSVFGLYPYSYASSASFILSGLSQVTGIEMEGVIWYYCMIVGLFALCSAYVLGKQIKYDDSFSIFLAFFISISPGVLLYLTWHTSARGLFIGMLPFFIYIILKIRTSKIKYSFLMFNWLLILIATHHLFYFAFLILLAFAVTTLFYKLKEYYTQFKIPSQTLNIIYLILFIAMFSMPFFTGLFIDSSRYTSVRNIFEDHIRYATGPLIFLYIGGFIYLSFKKAKTFEEWFLLWTLLLITPIMYIDAYGKFFYPIIVAIFVSIGLKNVLNIKDMNKKYVMTSLVIFLLLFTSFSSNYQHWRTSEKSHKWYMENSDYEAGIWIKNNTLETKGFIGNDLYETTRIFSVSERPTMIMPETDIIYGFVNESDIPIRKNSPSSKEFYMDNPFVLDESITLSPYFYINNLQTAHIDDEFTQSIINKYNLTYEIENTLSERGILVESLHENRNSIYDNGKICILEL